MLNGIFNGISNSLNAISSLVKAPFQFAGGLLQTALGVATLPFKMVGGLFNGVMGMASQTAMMASQMALRPFLGI